MNFYLPPFPAGVAADYRRCFAHFQLAGYWLGVEARMGENEWGGCVWRILVGDGDWPSLRSGSAVRDWQGWGDRGRS